MYYENHPIQSELKSRRIKWAEPYGPVAWCGVKEIREHNNTKKIYDIDPYVEVYQYRDNLYSLYAENADGMQDMWMHLVIGPERAMLIDTGFGIGDTKALVDSDHSTIYSNPIYQGDVVILCNQTLWWYTPAHAMIITRYDGTNRDFLCAGHSNNRQAYPGFQEMLAEIEAGRPRSEGEDRQAGKAPDRQ